MYQIIDRVNNTVLYQSPIESVARELWRWWRERLDNVGVHYVAVL